MTSNEQDQICHEEAFLSAAPLESESRDAAPADDPRLPRGLIAVLAIACGVIVANIYYAQPLAGPIGEALGLSVGATGLIVTLTQIGYGLGLLFVVPLGDLVETRALVVSALGVCMASLLVAATSKRATEFLVASLIIGVSSTAVQVLVPFAASLAPLYLRGRVVGAVMSGLLLGIMLARPVASFLDDLWGWRSIFYLAAGLMACIAVALMRQLPSRPARDTTPYSELLLSMIRLYRTTPVLRRRAFYQTMMFGAFTLFWTTTPLLLAAPPIRMSQRGIALFALAGVAGALAAPLAGRMADRGLSRAATGIAIGSAAIGFVVTEIPHRSTHLTIALLTAGAVLLDFGVQSTLVIGQRAIYTLGAEFRSRLNGLFMATFFAGGAVCSGLGAWAYANGGWRWASLIGMGLPALAMVYFATEQRDVTPIAVQAES
jgi:predicted MFS family arabinose efflux permease